jgi:hypothetical protein
MKQSCEKLIQNTFLGLKIIVAVEIVVGDLSGRCTTSQLG